MRLRNGRLIDPKVLAQHLFDIRVGARLRGLEATVHGFIEKKDGKPVLRISKSNEILQLAELTTKVQIDALKTKKPDVPSKEEKNAYKSLVPRLKDQSAAVRITGPLRNEGEGKPLKLEVRAFEFVGTTRGPST